MLRAPIPQPARGWTAAMQQILNIKPDLSQEV
jgi:hypothetical protein